MPLHWVPEAGKMDEASATTGTVWAIVDSILQISLSLTLITLHLFQILEHSLKWCLQLCCLLNKNVIRYIYTYFNVLHRCFLPKRTKRERLWELKKGTKKYSVQNSLLHVLITFFCLLHNVQEKRTILLTKTKRCTIQYILPILLCVVCYAISYIYY